VKRKSLFLLLAFFVFSFVLGTPVCFAKSKDKDPYGYKSYQRSMNKAAKLETKATTLMQTQPARATKLIERSNALTAKAEIKYDAKRTTISNSYEAKIGKADALTSQARSLSSSNPIKAAQLEQKAVTLKQQAEATRLGQITASDNLRDSRLTRATTMDNKAAAITQKSELKGQELIARSNQLSTAASAQLPKSFGIQRYEKNLTRANDLEQKAIAIARTDPTKAAQLRDKATVYTNRATKIENNALAKMEKITTRQNQKAEIYTTKANQLLDTKPNLAAKYTTKANKLEAQSTWISTGVNKVYNSDLNK